MNRDAMQSLLDAVDGIPAGAHDAAPAARISNDARSPGTVRTLSNGDLRSLAELFKPRPIAEYHEDMGNVLWWCWEEPRPFKQISAFVVDSGHNGKWLGEPPYVGSPNDLGFVVKGSLKIGTSDISGQPIGGTCIGKVGGWPGYHTHFTPLPPMPTVPK